MKPDDIWSELKRRRVVRVALAYAAALFMVLQVADLTLTPLGLPDWSYRFLLILGLAGFPVAVGLAWAFDVTPEGVRRDAGEAPEGKEVASGRVGRRTGPVVVAVAAVVAVAFGGWQVRGGPEPVGAEALEAELIAVVPFRVSSTDQRVTILREGVIDLLAPIFSRSPRIVDSGAMVSAWKGYVEDETVDLSEGEAVELARRLGAGRVLVGSVVGSGEGFALNARLLRVPGGEVIGDASVDGSADALRDVVSQMSAQILSMEAGIERGQIDVLDDVPLTALEEYLDGRRAYRKNAYTEARTSFSRALDIDSTFALAALGAREAVMMGFDADRFGLLARADRLLRLHADRLPPREREYAIAWLGGGRRSAVERVRVLRDLVGRVPDKAEAWYLLGDYLFHASQRVGEGDWVARSGEAFRRALEIDPGLEVAREHLLYIDGFFGDRVQAAEVGRDLLMRLGESEGTMLPRAIMAYALDDLEQRVWLESRLDTLRFDQVGMVAFGAEIPGAEIPVELVDRALDRLEFAAVAEADRQQSLEIRYSYLRSSGRAAEADDQLRLIEQVYGPRPRAWIEAALYWDGVAESAVAAAEDLAQALPRTGPLLWRAGGRDACILSLWRLREGDVGFAGNVADRLDLGADDADPRHGANALCAMVLRAAAAERSGAPEAPALLDQLVDVLDQGPTQAVIGWATLEAAWMLERRGDLPGAARVAAYRTFSLPFQFALSTITREGARLAAEAGDMDAARYLSAWYLSPRGPADPRFTAADDSIRTRVPEAARRVAPRD